MILELGNMYTYGSTHESIDLWRQGLCGHGIPLGVVRLYVGALL